MTRTKRDANLVRWATKQKRRVSNRCQTCAELPDSVLADIAAIAKAHREHVVTLSQAQLREKLIEDYGYSKSLAAFEKHVKNCAGGW